jgi:hypothetical protein
MGWQDYIRNDLHFLFEDDVLLKRLMTVEKARRGVPKNKLLFIGASDIADQCWCSMRAVLTARRDELGRFGQYFYNRLHYAQKLGLFRRWPNNPKSLLYIGEWLAFERVNEYVNAKPEPPRTRAAGADDIDLRDGGQHELEWWERGEIAEYQYAERYLQISWHFPWERYIVVGVPDGVTKDLVYEFKSTGRARYRDSLMRKGCVQADVYGLFFQRHRKRVQVYSIDTGQIDTSDEKVDKANAERFLRNFSRVDGGEFPRLPEPFKCRICDFARNCPLRVKHGLGAPS